MTQRPLNKSKRKFAVIVFALAAAPVIFIAAVVLGLSVSERKEPEPILYTVKREDFLHQLEVPGELCSSVNVEIKCEVSQLHTWRPKIKSVVPDGTMVHEGDVLMTIDDSELEERLVMQQIQLLGLEAKRRGAEMEIAAQEFQLESYQDGELALERLEKESSLYQAQEKEKQQRETLDRSLRLFDLGYITQSQLDAELTAYKKANNALELEILKSDLLERYVSKLKILTIEMQLYSSKVELATTDQSIATRQDRIKFFQENIDNSTIRAPRDGMVIHVVESDRGWDKQYLQVGTELYKGQVVFKLPNIDMMETEVTIEEEYLSEAKPGTEAEIRLDAVDGSLFRGTLDSVRPFAKNEGWAHRVGKRYLGTVSFDKESIVPWHDQIKPGLSAQVRLFVKNLPNVIQVPVHAVLTDEVDKIAQKIRDANTAAEEAAEEASAEQEGAEKEDAEKEDREKTAEENTDEKSPPEEDPAGEMADGKTADKEAPAGDNISSEEASPADAAQENTDQDKETAGVAEKENSEKANAEEEITAKRGYVLVWKNGKAHRRAVWCGASDDRFVVITDGLKEGERVICGAKSYRGTIIGTDGKTRE